MINVSPELAIFSPNLVTLNPTDQDFWFSRDANVGRQRVKN
jgi:hypothetical protein